MYLCGEIDFCDEKQNSGNIVFRLLKIAAEKRNEIESSLNNDFGFNHYEASSSRKHSLGISLNSMIIDAMGGRIDLSCAPDDDNYYPVNAIERLLSSHRRHPEAICSLAARVLEWQAIGELKPYNIYFL